jgi:hypothetical protein
VRARPVSPGSGGAWLALWLRLPRSLLARRLGSTSAGLVSSPVPKCRAVPGVPRVYGTSDALRAAVGSVSSLRSPLPWLPSPGPGCPFPGSGRLWLRFPSVSAAVAPFAWSGLPLSWLRAPGCGSQWGAALPGSRPVLPDFPRGLGGLEQQAASFAHLEPPPGDSTSPSDISLPLRPHAETWCRSPWAMRPLPVSSPAAPPTWPVARGSIPVEPTSGTASYLAPPLEALPEAGSSSFPLDGKPPRRVVPSPAPGVISRDIEPGLRPTPGAPGRTREPVGCRFGSDPSPPCPFRRAVRA